MEWKKKEINAKGRIVERRRCCKDKCGIQRGKITHGLRQRFSLSPIHFNLYTDHRISWRYSHYNRMKINEQKDEFKRL